MLAAGFGQHRVRLSVLDLLAAGWPKAEVCLLLKDAVRGCSASVLSDTKGYLRDCAENHREILEGHAANSRSLQRRGDSNPPEPPPHVLHSDGPDCRAPCDWSEDTCTADYQYLVVGCRVHQRPSRSLNGSRNLELGREQDETRSQTQVLCPQEMAGEFHQEQYLLFRQSGRCALSFHWVMSLHWAKVAVVVESLYLVPGSNFRATSWADLSTFAERIWDAVLVK